MKKIYLFIALLLGVVGRGWGQSGNCPLNKRVFGWHYWNSNTSTTTYPWDKLTDIAFFAYDVDPSDGYPINTTNSNQVNTWNSNQTRQSAQNAGVNTHLCIKLFNNNSAFNIFFNNSSAQTNLINKAVSVVKNANAKGINIDFEGNGLNSTYKTAFKNFVINLKQKLSIEVPNSELTIAFQGSYASNNTTFFSDLEPYIDLFILMGYDYYWEGQAKPGPVGPLYQFHNSSYGDLSTHINIVLNSVPNNKLLLAVPYYGRRWTAANQCNLPGTAGGTKANSTPTYEAIRNNTNNYYSDVKIDTYTFNEYACFWDNNGNFNQAFWDGAFTLQKKYNLVKQRNLGGVGIWALGYDGGYNTLWNLLKNNFSSCAPKICSDTLYDMGGPKGNYHNKEEYTFTINTDIGKRIGLKFLEIDLESGFDSLKIYDGSSTSAPLKLGITGKPNLNDILSSSNSLTFKFKSDGATNKRGYKIYYYCTSDTTKCIERYENNNTITTASNVFNTIGKLNIQDSLTINCPISKTNDIDYFSLALEGAGKTTIDLKYLPMNYQLEVYSGTNKVYSSYNNGVTSERIIINTTQPQTKAFTIKVYGEGGVYTPCLPYTLSVKWEPKSCQTITYTNVITPASSVTTNNGAINLTITSGLTPFSYLWNNGTTTKDLANIGDDTYTVTITGADGCQKVGQFLVGVQNNTTPFCSGTTTLVSQVGNFSDGSGANNYTDNSSCRWLIQPTNAQKINLFFNDFNIHTSDKIRIYDGTNSSAPLLVEYTGDTIPPSVLSTGGALYVHFLTDNNNNNDGFSAAYTTQLISSGGGSGSGGGTGSGIDRVEYWFDGDFANREMQDVIPSQTVDFQDNIDVWYLDPGLHSFHFRAIDQYGMPSPVTSDLFIKTPDDVGSNLISAYEYWTDLDFDNREYVSTSPSDTLTVAEDLDMSSLDVGLHSFHIRFLNEREEPSATSTDLFFKPAASAYQNAKITGYEHWFDGNFTNRTVQNVAPIATFDLVTNINAAVLPTGLHSFHIRFRDSIENWSAVSTDLFYKTDITAASNNAIVAYRYWFDNDFATKINANVSPSATIDLINNISATTLADGLHAFNIQFKDANGNWSAVSTDLFVKVANSSGNNAIVEYRYWFDGNFNANIQQITPFVATYTLINNINASTLNPGLHSFNIQFKDDYGNWSAVSSDIFIHTILPNDEPCDATNLTINAPPICANTSNASIGLNEPNGIQNCSQANNSLWYRFTPPKSGSYTLTMSNPSSGTLLDAWVMVVTAAPCPTPLPYTTILSCTKACNGTPNHSFSIDLNNLQIGVEYYVYIDGHSGSTGAFCIDVKELAPTLKATVFLSNVDAGTGLMDNYLTSLGGFPLSDPYAAAPFDVNFTHINNPIIDTTTVIVLNATGNDAIVDWVFLELRTGISGSTNVIRTKSALLQRDGDIVAMDGISPIVFTGTSIGNYYVTVRHRNHLGFRTLQTHSLTQVVTNLNFTNNTVALYGATPTSAIAPNMSIMNGGDANFDGSIDAFDTIFWETQNGLFDDYTNNADYNMDGSVDAFDTIIWELNNGKFQELD
jgi:spore germination protein YaaH